MIFILIFDLHVQGVLHAALFDGRHGDDVARDRAVRQNRIHGRGLRGGIRRKMIGNQPLEIRKKFAVHRAGLIG